MNIDILSPTMATLYDGPSADKEKYAKALKDSYVASGAPPPALRYGQLITNSRKNPLDGMRPIGHGAYSVVLLDERGARKTVFKFSIRDTFSFETLKRETLREAAVGLYIRSSDDAGLTHLLVPTESLMFWIPSLNEQQILLKHHVGQSIKHEESATLAISRLPDAHRSLLPNVDISDLLPPKLRHTMRRSVVKDAAEEYQKRGERHLDFHSLGQVADSDIRKTTTDAELLPWYILAIQYQAAKSRRNAFYGYSVQRQPFVDGVVLSKLLYSEVDWLKKPSRMIPFLCLVLGLLQDAYTKHGIVHMDLSPMNVMAEMTKGQMMPIVYLPFAIQPRRGGGIRQISLTDVAGRVPRLIDLGRVSMRAPMLGAEDKFNTTLGIDNARQLLGTEWNSSTGTEDTRRLGFQLFYAVLGAVAFQLDEAKNNIGMYQINEGLLQPKKPIYASDLLRAIRGVVDGVVLHFIVRVCALPMMWTDCAQRKLPHDRARLIQSFVNRARRASRYGRELMFLHLYPDRMSDTYTQAPLTETHETTNRLLFSINALEMCMSDVLFVLENITPSMAIIKRACPEELDESESKYLPGTIVNTWSMVRAAPTNK